MIKKKIEEIKGKIKNLDINEYVKKLNSTFTGTHRRNSDGETWQAECYTRHSVDHTLEGFQEKFSDDPVLGPDYVWTDNEEYTYSKLEAYKMYIINNWEKLGFSSEKEATWFTHNVLPEVI
jgi:hypothetical protein